MGGCVSIHHHNKPSTISSSSSSKKSKFRRRRFRRKVINLSAKSNQQLSNSNMIDTSLRNPPLPGSREDDWFDSAGKFESDCDEDFLSFQSDAPSPLGFDGTSISSVSSITHPNHEKCNDNVPCRGPSGEQKEKGGALTGNATTVSVTEDAKNGQSPNPAQPETRKKSVKWVDEQSNPTELPTKNSLQRRPIAGSKVPVSPIEKKVFGSWSHIEPCTFKVRAENYLRDRKKDFAPNCAAYYPFGMDVFLSQKKVDHIARFVELPQTNLNGKFPPLLVVNVQIPLYSPSIFQTANDGEGMSVVLYFRLSDSYSKEMGPHFLENFRRIIDDEVEQVRGYTMAPVRERLKILGRVVNAEDLQLNRPERKLMHAYNGKPILSRPQHEFYLGEDYFEIDLDMHRFSYVSRKGFDTFQNRLKHCILDVGLTIQGNKEEELPEQVLCCIRLNGIDHTNFKPLVVDQESL